MVQDANHEDVIEVARGRQLIPRRVQIGDPIAEANRVLLQHPERLGRLDGDDVRGTRLAKHIDPSASAGADVGHPTPRHVTIEDQRIEEVVEQRGRAKESGAVRVLRPLLAEIRDRSRLEIPRHEFAGRIAIVVMTVLSGPPITPPAPNRSSKFGRR